MILLSGSIGSDTAHLTVSTHCTTELPTQLSQFTTFAEAT